jgi:outer membrane protein assembly factor BamB
MLHAVVRWRHQIGCAPFNGSPIVGPDGTIYVVAGLHPPMSDSSASARYVDDTYAVSGLYALHPDGRQKWLQLAAGIDVDPFFDAGGRLYVRANSFCGAEALELHSLITIRQATGTLERQIPIYAWEGVPCPDADGTCYTVDDHGNLFCVARDGSQPWQVQTGDSAHYRMVTTCQSLFFSTEHALHAYSLSGEQLWYRDNVVRALLIIGSDGILRVWQSSGNLSAYAPTGQLLWSREVGRPGLTAALLGDDGTLYLCAENRCLCGIQASGDVRVIRVFDRDVTAGPRPSADGTVYVGCADQHLYALANDGSVAWRFRTTGALYSTPALGTDGSVYFGSNDGILYSLAPSGEQRWSFASTVGRTMTESPAIGPKNVACVTCADLRLRAVDVEGSILWTGPGELRVRVPPVTGTDGKAYTISHDATGDTQLVCLNDVGAIQWARALSVPVTAGPTVSPSGTVYLGDAEGAVTAVAATGKVLWRTELAPGSDISEAPVIGPEGHVYACVEHERTLFALNAAGVLLWQVQTGVKGRERPTVAVSSAGLVVFRVDRSRINAVTADGTIFWSYRFPVDPFLHRGPVLASDGSFYVAGWRGLFVFDSMGKLRLSQPVSEHQVMVRWLTVDAAGNALLDVDETYLRALGPDGVTLWEWRYPHPRSQRAAPALCDDGTIYLASADGYLYALSIENV